MVDSEPHRLLGDDERGHLQHVVGLREGVPTHVGAVWCVGGDDTAGEGGGVLDIHAWP